MKIVLWILFTYFSSRGALLYYNLIPAYLDTSILLALKGIFFIWLLLKLLNRNTYKKVGIKTPIFLILITVLCGVINHVSIEQLARFIFNAFGPIFIYYYISFNLNPKSCSNLFKYVYVFYIIQFIFSVAINIDTILKGNILVDDPFFGFYGYPRAYAFSYATSLLAGVLIFKSLMEKNKKFIFYIVPLFFTQIMAGAGTVILFSIISLGLTYLYFSWSNKKFTYIITGTLSFSIIVPIISFYQSKMMNFEKAMNDAVGTSILQNPKIYFFSKSIDPLISDFKKFFLGFGPGNYMSWTSKQFRLDLVRIYNDDLHESMYTDAYQAFNNIVGFWGDIGVFGLIGYYSLLITIYSYIKRQSKNNYVSFSVLFILIFSILLSTFQQVFEDVYYSFIFWIVLGILTSISNDESFNSKKRIPFFIKSKKTSLRPVTFSEEINFI